MAHLPGTQLGIIGLPHLAAELSSAGFHVITGENERVAVAAIRTAFSAGERFPVISADLPMPGLTPWLTSTASEVVVARVTAMRDETLTTVIHQVELPTTLGEIAEVLNLIPLPQLDRDAIVNGKVTKTAAPIEKQYPVEVVPVTTLAPIAPVAPVTPIAPPPPVMAPPPPPVIDEELAELPPEPLADIWQESPWDSEAEVEPVDSPVLVEAPAAPILSEGVESLADFAAVEEPEEEPAEELVEEPEPEPEPEHPAHRSEVAIEEPVVEDASYRHRYVAPAATEVLEPVEPIAETPELMEPVPVDVVAEIQEPALAAVDVEPAVALAFDPIVEIAPEPTPLVLAEPVLAEPTVEAVAPVLAEPVLAELETKAELPAAPFIDPIVEVAPELARPVLIEPTIEPAPIPAPVALDTVEPAHAQPAVVPAVAAEESSTQPVTIHTPESLLYESNIAPQDSRKKLVPPTPAAVPPTTPTLDVQSAIERGRPVQPRAVQASKMTNIILVVSATGGAGTTTVALALADAAANARRRAIVIDAAHGDIRTYLSLNSTVPSAADFAGRADEVVLSPAALAGLRPGLPALKFGAVVASPDVALSSLSLEQLASSVSDMAELVILDVATLRGTEFAVDSFVASGAIVVMVADHSLASKTNSRREYDRMIANGAKPSQFISITNKATGPEPSLDFLPSAGVVAFDQSVADMAAAGSTAYANPAVAQIADQIIAGVA